MPNLFSDGLSAKAAPPLPDVPDDVVESWQEIVDGVTARLRVPVGLIMRLAGTDLEVVVADGGGRNPHFVGERAVLIGSGMYCERVLATGATLCVPDAHREGDAWATNPCLSGHGLAAYLGYPIRWPDGRLFGTLCVLDTGAHAYSDHDRSVMELMRDLIESHLARLFRACNG